MKSIKKNSTVSVQGHQAAIQWALAKLPSYFWKNIRKPPHLKVTLYGSLAATGKGHMTNIAITDTLQPAAPVEIIWEPKIFLPFHPNGDEVRSVDAAGNETDSWTVFSVGGGALAEENDGASSVNTPDIYSMNHMTEILQWCEKPEKVIGNTLKNVRKKISGITCKKFGKPCRQPFAADWNRKAYCPVH